MRIFSGMRDLPSSILNEFIANVVVLVIFSLVGVLVENVLIKEIPALAPYKWIIYTILILWAGLLIYRSYTHATNERIFNPESAFRVLERYTYHCYRDMQHITHQRRFKLRAMRNNVSVFRNKFQWTGENYQMRCLEGSFRLTKGPTDGPMDTYDIDFGRMLKKGDEIEFTVEWQCENIEGRAKHFFSCNITQPTDKVILDLQINPPLQLQAITKSIYHIAADQALSTVKENVTNGRCIWIIEKPLFMHRYKIDFTEII